MANTSDDEEPGGVVEHVSIRLPGGTNARAAALAKRMPPPAGHLKSKRSTVLREALLLGLAALERKHGTKGK